MKLLSFVLLSSSSDPSILSNHVHPLNHCNTAAPFVLLPLLFPLIIHFIPFAPLIPFVFTPCVYSLLLPLLIPVIHFNTLGDVLLVVPCSGELRSKLDCDGAQSRQKMQRPFSGTYHRRVGCYLFCLCA